MCEGMCVCVCMCVGEGRMYEQTCVHRQRVKDIRYHSYMEIWLCISNPDSLALETNHRETELPVVYFGYQSSMKLETPS